MFDDNKTVPSLAKVGQPATTKSAEPMADFGLAYFMCRLYIKEYHQKRCLL